MSEKDEVASAATCSPLPLETALKVAANIISEVDAARRRKAADPIGACEGHA